MKKLLLLSLMLVLCVSVAVSQFGIKGGINIGTFGGDDKAINPAFFDTNLVNLPSVDPTSRTGFTAGISYKIGLPILTIQMEALYTQKGATYELALPAALGGGTGKGVFKLDYIDIPVVLRISPLPLLVVSPYIEAGASYSFLASAKFHGESPAGSDDEDIKDSITKNDLSILIGIGAEIMILDVNVRYVIGQTKILKDSDWKIYNRGIMLTVGITMP
jgi:opacity protein-like surface antigen